MQFCTYSFVLKNHSFQAYEGFFNYMYQKQVKVNMDPWADPEPIANKVETRVEFVPAPYYCVDGCGGFVVDPADINVFENGVCTLQNFCR